MSMARIYSKGQITLPRDVRSDLGVSPGDYVVVEPRGDEAVIRRPKGILEAGGLGAPKRRVPWEKVKEIVHQERAQARVRKESQ